MIGNLFCLCSHTQTLAHLLFVVWSSVSGHLQQEASGTLRIFHIEKSDTFSKGQSRAGGNEAHCIYIFSLSLCLSLALKSSDAILFLSEPLSEAISVPHSCRYLFSYCSFPLCQIHFDSRTVSSCCSRLHMLDEGFISDRKDL